MESVKLTIDRGNEYYSWHNSKSMDYKTAYNELMDNAIDNNATIIQFERTKSSITISDNGTGIKSTILDMENVLRMYKSVNKDKVNAIGHYGIGLKESTMRLGKAIKIRSRAEGYKTIEIDVPWSTMNYGDQVESVILDEETPVGTDITIFFAEDGEPAMPKRTSFRHYDLMIKSGKLSIIDINGDEYQPAKDPVFKEFKRYENRMVAGKRYDLVIGILDKTQKENVSGGFYVYSNETLRYFNYAVTTLENIDARDGLYISIALHNVKDNWKVDKNKNGIINISEIFDNEFIRLIDMWQDKLYKITTDSFLDKLAEEISQEWGFKPKVGKERRNGKQNNTGAVEPVEGEKERLQAQQVDDLIDGIVVEKIKFNRRSRFDINISTEGIPESQYLTITRGSFYKVTLNQQNKMIDSILKDNTGLKWQVLKAFINMAIYANSIDGTEIRADLVQELFTDHKYNI